MPQLETVPNPCLKCRSEFESQRTEYCREFLRYQRENFAQRTEINALEVQLKHALEKLLKAERELIQSWKTSQQKAEPVSHAVIVGSLFDFMGWLTSRKEQLVFSSVDNASPAADAIKVFAEMRSLSLDDARVQDWQNYTTQEAPKCSQA